MYYFCTYFDQNYLPRGLALYRSLREHCPEFKLWVLCMDHTSYGVLEKLNLPGIHPLSLEEFERNDDLLLGAKQNRSRIEYYFTCTPSLPIYILNNWSEVDLITYLDADLFFFASPSPLFEELGDGSIAIIGHRFSQHMCHLQKFGIFNVGWLSFRRDDNAFACLYWWRERCIEWCYDREEDGRFADQKYMDDWPSRFKNVVVLEHKGANLAPWNLSNYHLLCEPKGHILTVDNEPLIFFHFQGLKKIKNWLYDPSWIIYSVHSSTILRKKIYVVYLKTLIDVNTNLLGYHNFDTAVREVRSKSEWQRPEDDVIVGPLSRMKSRLRIGLNILMAKYFLVLDGRVIW
jgi:hypothetical protein